MNIDDKDLTLLHKLIYDKQKKMEGIISSLCINRSACGPSYYSYYHAFMNKTQSYDLIFVEDFEKGNVVFLIPFGAVYMEEEMEEMAQRHIAEIKEYFGDNFRDDMIMRMPEEERQRQIWEWDKLTVGLDNWGKVDIEKIMEIEGKR